LKRLRVGSRQGVSGAPSEFRESYARGGKNKGTKNEGIDQPNKGLDLL